MRLSDQEVRAIKNAVKKNFGDNVRVLLFGSRVDDTRRGGDIDLLVEYDPAVEGTDLIKKKLRTMSDIQFALGDQKIDIVTAPKSIAGVESIEQNPPLVVTMARSEGVAL